MTKLKPCPFCGKIPNRIKMNFQDGDKWCVSCENDKCLIQPSTPLYKSKGVDIKTWNKRMNYIEK